MPLINNLIPFSTTEVELINFKKNDPFFSHDDWGEDDLQTLRSRIRSFYRSEQGAICAYCQEDVSIVSAADAQVEHIVPKSSHEDFMFEAKNLCVICADCNQIKRSQEVTNEVRNPLNRPNGRVRYPYASSSFKIVHPHIDNYNDHIIHRGRIYIDKTDKGLFTISACKLNRYFHQFGLNDDLVNNEELSEIMTTFLDSNNIIEQARILGRLTEILVGNV